MRNIKIYSEFATRFGHALLGVVLSTACVARATSYISEVKSIDELYQACLERVSTIYNIHCINGGDETTGGKSTGSSPYSEFWKAANRNELKRSSEDDLNILRRMKIGGDAPSSGDKNHYAFVRIYRDFYAYSRVPVVKATALLYTVESGGVGVGYHVEKLVQDWYANALKVLPMVAVDSEEGRALTAKYQALVDATFQKERDFEKLAADKTKPKCTEIRFTGIAAIYPEDLDTVSRSKNKADLLAEYPLMCNTVSGGRNFNGAIMNPYSRRTCRGISYFQNQSATIQTWTANTYLVGANVDFTTGRVPLALWINRASATCLK